MQHLVRWHLPAAAGTSGSSMQHSRAVERPGTAALQAAATEADERASYRAAASVHACHWLLAAAAHLWSPALWLAAWTAGPPSTLAERMATS